MRAPDENVYIAPLNLIEIFVSGLFEWWMKKRTYEFINDCIMGFFYSPLLFVAAYFETRTAHGIRRNRARGEDDDDVVEEWERLAHELDFEADGWTKTCEAVKPNLDDDPAVLEVRKLRADVDEVKAMLAEICRSVGIKSTKLQESRNDGPSDGQPRSRRSSSSDNVSSDTTARQGGSGSSRSTSD